MTKRDSVQIKNDNKSKERKTHPKTTTRKHHPSLSDREKEAVDYFQEMLDQKFQDIKESGGFSTEEIYDLLNPYINAPNIVSKICTNPDKPLIDRRHVSLKLMAAMYRVFGISIDELLAECFESLETREPLNR